MSDKRELNEMELEGIQGGMMEWSGGNNVLTYTNADGVVTKYQVNGDCYAAFQRSSVLHSQSVPEDEILSILQSEGMVGSQL